jgi:hypothetical protein
MFGMEEASGSGAPRVPRARGRLGQVAGAPVDEGAEMSEQPQSGHHVRRVVLPSGRTIEVVYFDDPADAPAAESAAIPAERPVHVCPACAADLVYPVEWEEADGRHWEVTLRCPNCERLETDILHQEAVERFDEELDRGTEALVRDLRRLTHANMEDELDRLTAALRADAIWPMDF